MSKEKLRVYKYHRINEHLMQLFSLNAFYCCTSEDLNDPLEGKINLNEIFLDNLFHQNGEWQVKHPYFTLWMEFLIRAEKDREAYMLLDIHKAKLEIEDLSDVSESEKTRIILSYPKLNELFTEILLKEYNIRIISFSKFNLSKQEDREREKLMWSYYTGAAKGVRLTFDFNSPMESNWSNIEPIYFEPVIYDTKRPILKTEKDLFDCFRFKYEIWHRESEYRILLRNQKGIGFNQERLKEVTFGLNVDDVQIITIVRLCKMLQYDCKYNKLKYVDDELIEVPMSQAEIDTYVKLRDRTDFRIEI